MPDIRLKFQSGMHLALQPKDQSTDQGEKPPTIQPESDTASHRIPKRSWLWLALIVLIAAAMRLPDLTRAPVGGHGDVAWVGLNALDWVDRGVWSFYIREMYAPEFPVVYLNGLLLPFTGISYLSPRLITAFTGLLFVAFLFPATWWLTANFKRGFREKASLFAAAAGALSIHAMYLSRLGMESPPFLAVLTLLVWLTAWAWQRGSEKWQNKSAGRWILAGIALGFAQYIYLPARLLPILMAVWFSYSWLVNRQRLREQLRWWLIMAAVAFIVTLPAIILFVTVPGSFSGRADTGTAVTGGWIWAYDLSQQGGMFALLLRKIELTLLAFGIFWNGPYTLMNQPMLTPVFFVGLLVSAGAFIHKPREQAYAWPLLAIPVMLITDLISGAVAEIHALHQMGVLPFVFILSGIGLAHLWEGIARLIGNRSTLRLGAASLLGAVAIVPSAVLTNRYLNVVIPAQYADPRTGWQTEQIDVDLSEYILANPNRAYLVNYAEYSRSNIAWLLSDKFRDRRSAINTNGQLAIPNAPSEVTVVMADSPERPRHDARPSKVDSRLWVLLNQGKTVLLPPLTLAQDSQLQAVVSQTQPEPYRDRSHTEIARLYTIPANDLFTTRPVIDVPMDTTFNDEIQLKGYTVRTENLQAGQVLFVTAYWQAIKPPSEDYPIFVQVWNDQKQALASTHDFPFGGAYRTRIWRTDEIVATQHWVQLPDPLPVGRYSLAFGMTHLIGERKLAVTGGNADAQLQVALAPDLRVAPTQTQAPSFAAVPDKIQFGDTFALREGQMTINGTATPFSTNSTPLEAAPKQAITLDLTWEALARPAKDYSLFVHLAPSPDVPPVAQADVTLGAAQNFPSGAWRSGECYAEHVSLALPDTLPPGNYDLLMGIYYWQDNTRLSPNVNGKQSPDGQIKIVTVHVGE